jgi:hypothetical protein
MAIITINFTADNSGESITFRGDDSVGNLTVQSVSLREIVSIANPGGPHIKEFLSGTTDDGKEIFFRADTQQMQLNTQFETFSNPIAIATRTQRGSMVKCFVALDDGDFYEIQGTVTKGVSIVKVHSRDKKSIPTPPIAREIRVSWRDGSKQLCRLLQTSIIFIPGTMDFSE